MAKRPVSEKAAAQFLGITVKELRAVKQLSEPPYSYIKVPQPRNSPRQVRIYCQIMLTVWKEKNQPERTLPEVTTSLGLSTAYAIRSPRFGDDSFQVNRNILLEWCNFASYRIEERDLRAGVYFLISDEKVVYIGSSVCPIHRVATHRSQGQKIFDSVAVIDCDSLEAAVELEGALIRQLTPFYNGGEGKYHGCKPPTGQFAGRDREILAQHGFSDVFSLADAE